MWKIIGRDISKALREYLFFNPNPNVSDVLKEINNGDVVLVMISRGNNDSTVWCKEVIKARRVA